MASSVAINSKHIDDNSDEIALVSTTLTDDINQVSTTLTEDINRVSQHVSEAEADIEELEIQGINMMTLVKI